MKFTDFQRKAISLIVLATFVALLHFWAPPAQAATTAGNSETTITQGDSNGPAFIEEENDSEPVIKKAKKFPWLIVGLGVVAVGVAVYFLVIKKPKYTLTVTLGTGCTGTPASTTKYSKGVVVTYNYSASAGYFAQVKLDGVDVPASGTVIMDKDKALTVSAEPDIRGTWSIAFSATNTYKNWTWTMTFTGSDPKNGSAIFSSYVGTYTVDGNNVSIKFNLFSPNDLVMTGTFSSINAMSGTAVLTNILIGGVHVTNANWTATRTAATTANTAPRTAAEAISRK